MASSTVDSVVSEEWSTEEDEDAYDDYYGESDLLETNKQHQACL